MKALPGNSLGTATFLGVAALLFAGTHALDAAEAPFKIPPQGELLSSLKKEHPRLLVSETGFTELKTKVAADPLLQQWHAKLKKQGDDLIDAPVSKYEIPDGLRLLATSRRVLERVYTLALLYRLEGDRKYSERAWKELAAAAEFPDWNPKHFLDTAEMTHAFAIGYDWLYDAWTSEQRDTLRTAMVEKGFKPGLTVYRARSGWSKARHNWNQVCNGGLGMGALALGDVEPDLSAEVLWSAVQSLPLAMAEFAPDGAWAEGPGYWAYATSYNVVILAALQSALGTDFGLSGIRGFNETGFFPLYLTGPLGRTFNYADGGDRALRAPQMFWFARRFNQPVFAWYERHHASPSAQDMVWYDAAGSGPNATKLALDRYFREAEVAVMRSDWEDPKALFLAFKAGDNKANHSHLDLGSFVFDALGARWAVDLGADDYNLPAYFGNKRWTYYRLRAEGQNTLVINPGEAPDQDPAAAARITRFASTPARAFAIADLTAAYSKHARSVSRGLLMLERQRVLIQDEIRPNPDKSADVWWFMHTPASVRIDSDGHTAELDQLGVKLRAQVLSPPGASLQIRDPVPLPSSPQPEKQASNQGIKKLAIHLEVAKDTRISVLLTPITGANAGTAGPPKLSALSEW